VLVYITVKLVETFFLFFELYLFLNQKPNRLVLRVEISICFRSDSLNPNDNRNLRIREWGLTVDQLTRAKIAWL
jgi:hypothetical protein